MKIMDIVKQECVKFLQSTSIRGIGRIIKAKGIGFKMLWTIAVLGFGILCIIFASILLGQYISYSKTSKVHSVSYKQEEGRKILEDIKPAITLCNSNALRSRAEYPDNVITREEFSAKVRKANISSKHLPDMDGMESYFHYLGLENAKRLGHQQEDFIIDCKVYVHDTLGVAWPEPCSEYQKLSISYLPIPEFFNCYSINIEEFIVGNEDQSLDVASLQSVALVLYADNIEKHSDSDSPHHDVFLPMDGIKIYLHQQNALIPMRRDVTVYPGQNLHMDVSLTVLDQLSFPYGDCQDTPPKMSAKTLDGQQLQYTKFGCQLAELQRHTYESCSCVYPTLPLFDTTNGTFETSVNCLDVEYYPTKLHCVEEETFNFKCPDVCKEISYQNFLASFLWPHIRHLNSFYDQYIAERKFEDNFKNILQNETVKDASPEAKQQLHQQIQQNFILVKINFDTDHISVNKELALYTFTSFISHLGGLLNLWSGVSFIVAIELVDLVAKILLKCFKSQKIDRNVTEKSEEV